MNPPRIAVIVPAYNAAQTLRPCLEAVASQSKSPDEIIVVDDGSDDDTAALAESIPGVRCIRQPNAGPAAARNRGQREARADIILFTDADCIPAEDWVERSASGFTEPDVGAVAGSYGVINKGARLARCIHAEILFRHRRLMPAYPRSFGSYNVAIQSRVFDQVGGFEETYRHASGEDNDLSYKIRRAGYRIRFEPRSLVAHHHPERIGRYLKEQYRHGFWRVKMYRDHPHMAGGDDYTFWKDIAEVGAAGGIGLSILLGAATGWWSAFVVLSAFMLLLQLWFGFRFCRGAAGDAIFYTAVLTARSFARALGFSSGMTAFLIEKLTKKK